MVTKVYAGDPIPDGNHPDYVQPRANWLAADGNYYSGVLDTDARGQQFVYRRVPDNTEPPTEPIIYALTLSPSTLPAEGGTVLVTVRGALLGEVTLTDSLGNNYMFSGSSILQTVTITYPANAGPSEEVIILTAFADPSQRSAVLRIAAPVSDTGWRDDRVPIWSDLFTWEDAG